MRRSALVPRELRRKAPLRRQSKSKAGMSRAQRETLHQLHRAIVMLRAAASLVTDSGKLQWWGACEWCGKDDWLTCAHIESVGEAPHLRYHPMNARALCWGCHRWRWHKFPRMADAWIRAHAGDEMRDLLVRLAKAKPTHRLSFAEHVEELDRFAAGWPGYREVRTLIMEGG